MRARGFSKNEYEGRPSANIFRFLTNSTFPHLKTLTITTRFEPPFRNDDSVRVINAIDNAEVHSALRNALESLSLQFNDSQVLLTIKIRDCNQHLNHALATPSPVILGPLKNLLTFHLSHHSFTFNQIHESILQDDSLIKLENLTLGVSRLGFTMLTSDLYSMLKNSRKLKYLNLGNYLVHDTPERGIPDTVSRLELSGHVGNPSFVPPPWIVSATNVETLKWCVWQWASPLQFPNLRNLPLDR